MFRILRVGSKKMEPGHRMNYACFLSSSALGLEDGPGPTFWVSTVHVHGKLLSKLLKSQFPNNQAYLAWTQHTRIAHIRTPTSDPPKFMETPDVKPAVQ